MKTASVHDVSGTSWETLPIESVRQKLQTPESGLSSQTAELRLKEFGENTLEEKPPTSVLMLILRQFESPLILILIVAAVISLLAGENEDAFFIGIVLFLNSMLGTSQEFRAERGARALRHLVKVSATVQRNGKVAEINSANLVPGDIVFLESGNIVPGDIRLEATTSLEVDESILTGESISASKNEIWTTENPANLADRKNMLFAGTTIAKGRASGIVVETGPRTELGKIAGDVAKQSGGVPPLVKRMQHFSKTIGIAVLLVAGILAGIEFVIHDSSVTDAFEFAVALAISAIPEGLPIALTITLAVGSRRMSRRNAIVRRLAAVEGLGSCTLIATDKTGTLTCNELTVKKIQTADGSTYDVSGEGFSVTGEIQPSENARNHAPELLDEIIRAGVMCNEANLVPKQDGTFLKHGDAVDLALLVLGLKHDIQRDSLILHLPQFHAIPFEPELQFSATWHHDASNQRTISYYKGAPERILGMCRMTDQARAEFLDSSREIAAQGYRVLALANRTWAELIARNAIPDSHSELNLLGIVAMIDPPRSGVQQAVEKCHRAGVDVIMVTGDHRLTALAIARQLGIVTDAQTGPDIVINGSDFENRPEAELIAIVQKAKVFARVSPRQKLELVKIAQKLGHFVAVTGDGANDAPALKHANIAIAMGKSGTDVARESADLVLSDDNFATIVAGIEEGRIAYDNIRKVIVLLVSTGIGEIMMVLFALVSGLPLPLTPLQLLWLNVATEAIQDESLAFEPNEGDAMQRSPRPTNEPVFNRIMIERIFVGASVMGLVGFGLFATLIRKGYSVHESRNALLLLMVLFENVHIGNCRSEMKSIFQLSPLTNPLLILGVALAFAVHLTAMYTPWFQRVLAVQPVDNRLWCILIGLALLIVPVVEIHKWFCRRRFNKKMQ